MSIELTMLRVTPSTYDSAMRGEWDGSVVAENGQVGKEWELLAFILAGPDREHPEPAYAAIMGGERVPGEPDDYGGTRALSPAQVAEANAALARMTDEEFRARYETYDFTGAYCADGARPSRELEFCWMRFRHLRDFYMTAADDGDAMILEIC